MGSHGLRPWLPIPGQGRPQLDTLMPSLVIQRHANTCRIVYSNNALYTRQTRPQKELMQDPSENNLMSSPIKIIERTLVFQQKTFVFNNEKKQML